MTETWVDRWWLGVLWKLHRSYRRQIQEWKHKERDAWLAYEIAVEQADAHYAAALTRLTEYQHELETLRAQRDTAIGIAARTSEPDVQAWLAEHHPGDPDR